MRGRVHPRRHARRRAPCHRGRSRRAGGDPRRHRPPRRRRGATRAGARRFRTPARQRASRSRSDARQPRSDRRSARKPAVRRAAPTARSRSRSAHSAPTIPNWCPRSARSVSSAGATTATPASTISERWNARASGTQRTSTLRGAQGQPRKTALAISRDRRAIQPSLPWGIHTSARPVRQVNHQHQVLAGGDASSLFVPIVIAHGHVRATCPRATRVHEAG